MSIPQYDRGNRITTSHHQNRLCMGRFFWLYLKKMTIPFRYLLLCILAASMLIRGCENDIERINLLTDESSLPKVKGTNIKVIYSDSARVKVQILAPAFRQFPDLEEPYMEFPEGIQVYFYDDSLQIESEIRADYAIYHSEQKLWKATGNVVGLKRPNGDAIHTEEMYWDEANERIYSDTYTKIQNEDGVFYGKRGFESHQNLSNWQLIGTSGTMNVQDEE